MRQGGNVRQNRTLDKLQAGSCTSGHVDTLSLVLYTLQAVAVSPPTMTVVKPASVAATMFSIIVLVPASKLATSKTPIPDDGLVGSDGRSVQLDGLGTDQQTNRPHNHKNNLRKRSKATDEQRKRSQQRKTAGRHYTRNAEEQHRLSPLSKVSPAVRSCCLKLAA